MPLSANDEQLLLEIYQKIIDNSPNLIFLIKKHFNQDLASEGIPIFVYANKTARDALNYSLEEIINPTSDQTKFFHPEDILKVKTRFKMRLNKEIGAKVLNKEMLKIRLVSKDGIVIPVLYSMVTIDETSDVDDPLFHFDGIDLRPIENKAKEFENLKRRYDHFLAESQDGIYSTDKDGNITYFNKSAAMMIEYDSEDQLLGKNIAKEFYYSPDGRDEFISNIIKKGHISNFPVRLKNENGELRIVSVSSVLIKDDFDNILGVDGLFRDITEKRLFTKFKDELIENMTNELNSISVEPNLVKKIREFIVLGTIEVFQNYQKIIVEELGDKYPKDKVNHIERVINVLYENVKKYELINYLKKAEKEREIKKVDLNEIVTNVLDNCNNLGLQYKIEKLLQQDEAWIKGKRYILQQLLSLLLNEKYASIMMECEITIIKLEKIQFENSDAWKLTIEMVFDENLDVKSVHMRKYGIEEYLLSKMIRKWGGKVYFTENMNRQIYSFIFPEYKTTS